MGRTKGSANKAGHNAGGDRKSADFFEKKAEENERKKQAEERRKASEAARRERAREAAAKREQELKERRQKRIEQTRESLQNISEDDLEHLLFRRRSHQGADDAGNDGDDDDDGDYDDDDEEDFETEDEGEGEVKQRRLRQRAAWKPEEGTAINIDLKQFEQKLHGNKSSGQMRLINNVRDDVMRGKQWFGPESDPLSTGKDTNPEAWYLSQLWKFVWMPFDQYRNHANLKDLECVHCKKQSVKSHRYDWRPMFHHERVVMLYHRRVRCEDCGKTCAEIDPRFLSQLPTRVLECFPFVTTSGGPGVHESMVHEFANLFTKRIMFGPFTQMVNELHSIRYDKTQLSYYDAVAEARNGLQEDAIHGIPPPTCSTTALCRVQ